MLHDVIQRPEPPVMIEAALRPREQAAERRRAILLLGRSIRLKIIDADFVGGMHRPAWLAEQRGDMAADTLGLLLKHELAAIRGVMVERILRRLRRRNRQL